MGSTQPNPTHVGWVGLGWTYVMGWVGSNFFWPTMVGRVKKFPQPDPTRPMHTPIHYKILKMFSTNANTAIPIY